MIFSSRGTHTQQSGTSLFFRRAFPVPKALILSSMAVEISDGAIRYFGFEHSRGKSRPKSYGVLPIPRIHIGDTTEKTREEAADAIKQFSAAHGPFVRAVVHEGDAYVFKINVPTVDRKDLRAAIEGSLEANVPIPPAEALFEFEVVSVDPVRRETTVAVTVISEKVVSEYIDVLRSGGLFPVSFETEARSLARSLVPKGDQGTHAVLAVRRHHSVVFVVEKGIVTFSSSVEAGSADLDKAIAKTFNMKDEEAAALRAERSFRDDADNGNIFEAMIPVFAVMRDELGKMIVFSRGEAKRTDGGGEVSDVILAGGDALTSGFAKYISVTTKLPAKAGSVWTNVSLPPSFVPDIGLKDSLDYGTVIGALL